MKISREVFREKEGINSIFITRIYLSKIVHHSSKDPRNWTSSTRRRNLVCILVVRTFSLCRLDKQSIPRFFLFTRKKWTENHHSHVFFFFCILYKFDIDVDWDDFHTRTIWNVERIYKNGSIFRSCYLMVL